MFFRLTLFFATLLSSCIYSFNIQWEEQHLSIVETVKRLTIPEFPGAFNPSIARINDQIFMSFRFSPDIERNPWINYIGIVELNSDLEIIGNAHLIKTRGNSAYYPLSEDARLFNFKNELWIIFNDAISPNVERRDMFISPLKKIGEIYTLAAPRKLTHTCDYITNLCQKNWNPFEYCENILLTYKVNPHEILYPDLDSGISESIFSTYLPTKKWKYGHMRGGTPALKIGSNYLSFFHSSIFGRSEMTPLIEKWHYYMGAYTFSSEPPFEITGMTVVPITHPEFYDRPERDKYVIFPGGYIFDDEKLHVAYGKDDLEIWIATINTKDLLKSIEPIKRR